MANVPSGIGNLPSGIGNFSPAGYSLPGNLNLPSARYNFLARLPLAPGAGYAAGSAPVAGSKAQPHRNGPADVTGALMQTFGVGSPFNPMTFFDLMNRGLGPFAGSGLPGYPPATPGAGMSASAGPAVSDAFAAGAPVPRSGGKGVMG